MLKAIRQSRIWRSIFRQGYPDNREDQSKVMVNSLFLHIHPVRVHLHSLRARYSMGLGIISAVLFVVTVITGAWLMFYYAPSVERAYTDIQNIQTSVTFGALIRNMHRWAAHLMVLTVFLHMVRVFLTGGYKHPREFNWVIGVGLWLVTLMLSFTGYLLPWDQLAYWAITVSTNIAATIPIIGQDIQVFLLGGLETGPESLVRFYALHIAVLPIILTLLMAIHFWRIRKDGGLSKPNESIDEQTATGEPVP
jgi:quinol-cytochrome oxidoreductase complex cytochrome b subunit